MQHTLTVTLVDYQDEKQRNDVINMLINYSADPMGGGKPLERSVAERSIALMAEKDYAFSFLCYDKATPVGFANCFESIATFAGKTAINIHDIAIIESHRGQGLGSLLLEKITEHANTRGCYKITLEVLEGNTPAKNAYEKSGFAAYQLAPELGSALFYQKIL